jgi:hypothetical protein
VSEETWAMSQVGALMARVKAHATVPARRCVMEHSPLRGTVTGLGTSRQKRAAAVALIGGAQSTDYTPKFRSKQETSVPAPGLLQFGRRNRILADIDLSNPRTSLVIQFPPLPCSAAQGAAGAASPP